MLQNSYGYEKTTKRGVSTGGRGLKHLPRSSESLPSVPLQTFYRQVSSPLLRRINVQFPDDSVSDITQNRFDKYFSGSELVVAGKVLPSESNTLTSLITASAVSFVNAVT